MSFVGAENKPIPQLDREVKQILKQTEADAPKVKPTFTRGQNVRIIDGPFAEFIGVVDEVSAERNKVKVLVSFFGRETPVELDFLQVEKLEGGENVAKKVKTVIKLQIAAGKATPAP